MRSLSDCLQIGGEKVLKPTRKSAIRAFERRARKLRRATIVQTPMILDTATRHDTLIYYQAS